MLARHDKIILTGFRATGKSTVGKMLALELGLDFLDMDRELTGRLGPISEVVARHGWPFFRQREKELLKELVNRTGLVIAAGGGAILHTDIWPELKETGLVIWLSAPVAVIKKRLGLDGATAEQRPSLTGADVRQEVEELLREREPLYRRGSHLQFDTAMASPGGIARQILSQIRSRNGR